MIVYRIENLITNAGMWYASDGTFAPFIYNLTEGISKNVPMGFNPEHKEGGVNWCSSAISKEQMNHWFSARDALELHQSGYQLYELDVATFKKKEHEVLFCRESIIARTVIPLDKLWDMASVRLHDHIMGSPE